MILRQLLSSTWGAARGAAIGILVMLRENSGRDLVKDLLLVGNQHHSEPATDHEQRNLI